MTWPGCCGWPGRAGCGWWTARREDVFPGHQPGPRLRHAHLRPPARGDPQRVLRRLGGARRRDVPLREHRGDRRRRPLRPDRPGHGQPGELHAGPGRADAGDRRRDQPHPARPREAAVGAAPVAPLPRRPAPGRGLPAARARRACCRPGRRPPDGRR